MKFLFPCKHIHTPFEFRYTIGWSRSEWAIVLFFKSTGKVVLRKLSESVWFPEKPRLLNTWITFIVLLASRPPKTPVYVQITLLIVIDSCSVIFDEFYGLTVVGVKSFSNYRWNCTNALCIRISANAILNRPELNILIC